jgi:putative hydrolase of the HAD superfamily
VGASYARLAAAHGVALPAWRLEDAFRRVWAAAPPMVFPGLAPAEVARREREWWRSLVRQTFLAADATRGFPDFEAFFAALWRHFAEPAAWQPRPGARELLAALRARGLKLAVVSNFDGRLPALLAGLGLAPLLDAVLLPGEVGAAKPDPRIFAAALARLGVAAGEALYVGDDAERDLAGARAAGLAAVDARSLATLDALQIPGGDAP